MTPRIFRGWMAEAAFKRAILERLDRIIELLEEDDEDEEDYYTDSVLSEELSAALERIRQPPVIVHLGTPDEEELDIV